jgi:predicted membrane protein DUF2142
MAGTDAGRRGVPRALRLAAAVLAVAIGGTGNVLRTACWTQTDGFVCGPFAGGSAMPAPTTVTGLTRIAVPAPAWRPLRVTLRARSSPGVAAAPLRVAATASLAGATSIAPDGPAVTLAIGLEPAPDRLMLWAEPARPGGGTIDIVAVSPARAAWPGLRAFAMGALAVTAVVWAIGGRRPGRASEAAPGEQAAPVPRSKAATAALAGLLVVYVAWLFLRPPMHSPDEPQHHARATSIPSAPWVGGRLDVTIVAAHRNPLTWTPNALHAMVLNPGRHLRAEDLDALRVTPWLPASAYPPAERFTSAAACYPPLYYWLVFAGGESLTRLLDLTPWASLYAYRLVSLAGAWLLWIAVYRVLAAAPDTRAHALPICLVMAGTPTVATLASSVNPDALAIPAAVLLFVASWRVLAAGERRGTALAAAALTLALKPTGLFAFAAVAVSAAAWAWQRPEARARAAGLVRDLFSAWLLAWIVFYAWSPTAILPAPTAIALPAYLTSLVTRAPGLWSEFWGRPGWTDVSAAPLWYVALALVCAAGAVVARVRRSDDGGFARHALVTSAAFAAFVVASEVLYHPVAGLYLQGRYFAPAGLALGPLVARRDALRWLLPILVAALHVALAIAAVDRYFAGDWSLWWRSISGS